MNVLKLLFGLYKESDVKKGGIYKFRDEVDPFGVKTSRLVKVKDVKDGWVNYRFLNSKFFQNEVMKINSFLLSYELKED